VQFWTDFNGRINIGEGCYINQGVTLAAASLIDIGPHVRIGEMVAIHDTAFHPVNPQVPTRTQPIRIGRNAWLGHGAVILPGVTIGEHSVVGAGAVVSKDVPPKSIAAGVPAVVIRTFDCPDDWKRP